VHDLRGDQQPAQTIVQLKRPYGDAVAPSGVDSSLGTAPASCKKQKVTLT